MGLCMLISINSIAQDVSFSIYSSWQAVLDQSKAEGKPIFVDVYTEWCGPCKWMDQNVFNESEVGEFMNREFINIKVDAEKGWGKIFVKQYHVQAYPTYLFFNTKGEMVMTTMGSKSAHRFLNESQNALEKVKSGNTVSSNVHLKLQELITQGQMNSDRIWELLSTLDRSGSEMSYYLELYLDHLHPDSLFTPLTAVIINKTLKAPIVPSSRALNILLTIVKDRPIYTATISSAWITLMDLFQSTADIAGSEANDALLTDVLSLQDTLYRDKEMANLFKSYYTTRYFAKTNNYPKFINQFEAFLTNHFLQADWDIITKIDHSHFIRALELKYGTVDRGKIEKEKYDLACRIHYSLFRLSFTQLQELTMVFQRQFPERFEDYNKEQMIQAMQTVMEMYKKNQINVSSGLINNNQKYIERYKIN